MSNETPILPTNPIKDGYVQCAVCEVRRPPEQIHVNAQGEKVCVDKERCKRFYRHMLTETP